MKAYIAVCRMVLESMLIHTTSLYEVLEARIKFEKCMRSNRPHQHEAQNSLLQHLGCSLIRGKGLQRMERVLLRRLLREPRDSGLRIQGLGNELQLLLWELAYKEGPRSYTLGYKSG